MTALVWDSIGDRKFQTGVDRGVLYLLDGRAIPWNGLTGVEEVGTQKVQPYYQDGIKYMNHQILGNAEVNVKAFTYPEDFNRCLGIESSSGVNYHDRKAESFSFSYRSLIGNDIEGLEYGYVIHVLYNLTATPGSNSHSSVGGSITPMEFSWNFSSMPEIGVGIRPTAHISIPSTNVDPATVALIEQALYGSANVNPSLAAFTTIIAPNG